MRPLGGIDLQDQTLLLSFSLKNDMYFGCNAFFCNWIDPLYLSQNYKYILDNFNHITYGGSDQL